MAFVLTERSAPRRATNEHDAAAGAVGIAAVGAAIFLLWKESKGTSSSVPCNLPDGLYQTCSVPGNPNSCTIWAVKGCKRWGISTPAQLLRCYGPNPTITILPPGGFGNGDDPHCGYVGTVGFVSACSTCPPAFA